MDNDCKTLFNGFIYPMYIVNINAQYIKVKILEL